ncbi:MAG: carboxypeptidase-like regulatory domain-containing protein [Candidatus Aminicenantales bacterium]
MLRLARFVGMCGALLISAVLLFLPSSLRAQETANGNLIGYVYDKDGTTPVPGAVVKLRNISTGAFYEGSLTDKQGFFKIDRLSKGIYSFGITTLQGDFNSNELIGILEDETTRVSISLSMYEGAVQSAAQEVLRGQQEKEGEARIGRVVQYHPDSREASVFIEKGLLQLEDRIRVRGPVTNFYQDVKLLKLKGDPVKRALAGQSPDLRVVKSAEPGDIVYIVCKKGVTPFFLTPCGIAAIIAGGVGIITLTEEEPVSPFKK